MARGHAPDTIHFVGSNSGIEAREVPAAGFGLDELPGRVSGRNVAEQREARAVRAQHEGERECGSRGRCVRARCGTGAQQRRPERRAIARESPALEIISILESKKAHVTYHDPHVPAFTHEGKRFESVKLDAATIAEQDCVVIATDHSSLDYKWIAEHASSMVDTRNAMKDANGYRHKVTKL